MARVYQDTPYRLRHSGGLLSVSRTAVCAAIIASAMLLAVSGQESLARIDVRVAVAPTPFKGSDGLTHLAYELVVNDIPRMGAQIDRIEVFAESDAKPLITYAGSDLDQRVREAHHGTLRSAVISGPAAEMLRIANPLGVPSAQRRLALGGGASGSRS